MRPPLTCKRVLPPLTLPEPLPLLPLLTLLPPLPPPPPLLPLLPPLTLPEPLPLPDPLALPLPELWPPADPLGLPLPEPLPLPLPLPEPLPLLDRVPLPPEPAALGGDDETHPVENDAAAAPDKTATARPNGESGTNLLALRTSRRTWR